MRKELLRISHVDLERDGELLLDDLEFQMFAGEIVGLVARNRKGQKEMVDLICRNDPISLGSVWYDGNVVNSYAYSSGESNKVALIEQKMVQLGTKNREAYLRKMALDGYVVRLELPELKELVSLMLYSSNNLNQLTRRVHETGRIYDADLEDISRRQEALWDGVHQVLTQLAKLT